MTIIKRIALILIGVLLSLIILEIGLQTISLTSSTIKNYKTNKLLKNKDTITILCVGESTTDNTWPPILQEILDKKSKNKKFNVIDKAKSGFDTDDIVNIVSETISRGNKINIIISMIGINDHDKNVVSIKKIRFKILKLFYLIKKHIVSNLFAQEQNIYKENDFNNIIKIVNKYIYEKRFKDSINLLENINDTSLSTEQLETKYNLLIHAYYDYANLSKDYKNIFPILKKYILYIRNINEIFCFDIYLKILIYEKNIEQIKELFSDPRVIDENFDPIMCSLNDLSKIGAVDIIEQIKDKIKNSINDNSNIDTQTRKIGYMALNYFINKEYTVSNKLFDLQTKILSNNISKQTIKNYFKLYKICKHNNIKLIAMQYPIRNIKPLKQMLKNFDGITFVSNEENFKLEIKTRKIEEIFVDRFAGDFGHCTELGNTLIAENVAETILKLYN